MFLHYYQCPNCLRRVVLSASPSITSPAIVSSHRCDRCKQNPNYVWLKSQLVSNKKERIIEKLTYENVWFPDDLLDGMV